MRKIIGLQVFLCVIGVALSIGLVSQTASAGDIYLVKDINLAMSSNPIFLTDHNGTLFFRIYEEYSRDQLWKSDGTVNGTTLVKFISPSPSSAPIDCYSFNNKVFFDADDGVTGSELWMSDGTTEGTTLVADINPYGPSYPMNMTSSGNYLFFSADDGNHGRELWVCDVSSATPNVYMPRDIRPFSMGSEPQEMIINPQGNLLLSVVDDAYSRELFIADLAVSTTPYLLKDINPYGSSEPTYLCNSNGYTFFNALHDDYGSELWKTDGTAAGTQMVKDVHPSGHSGPEEMIDVNGIVYYRAQDDTHGLEVWRTDGTSEGTQMVVDLAVGNSWPIHFTRLGNQFVFLAPEQASGLHRLWISDGTELGTHIIKEINPAGDATIDNMKVIEGILYFTLDDGTHGFEPWRSDGTAEGTYLLADINPSGSSFPSNFTKSGNRIFFSAEDATFDRELWAIMLDLDIAPPTPLEFSCPQGGTPSPSNQSWLLHNEASEAINWSATPSVSWLALSATSGTLPGSATDEVLVTLQGDFTSWAAGVYMASVTFTSSLYEDSFVREVELTLRGIDHFEWDWIDRQEPDEPFLVTVTAKDSEGITISDFNGTANLSGIVYDPSIQDVTVAWSNEVGPFGGTYSPSSMAYNFTTDHFILTDYSTGSMRVVSGTDGQVTGHTLSMDGLNLGTYGIFSICVAEDGVIYGGANIGADGTTGVYSLIRWENEWAIPTQQDILNSQGQTMVFPRAMDAIGSGADTVIAVVGDNSYMVSLLTTEDGHNFSYTDNTPSGGIIRKTNGITPYPYGKFKQGVALDPSLNRLFGTQADGWGELAAAIKDSNGNWMANDSFTPPTNYAYYPGGLGGASPIGFSPFYNALFVLGYLESSEDYISILDANTGSILKQLPCGFNTSNYCYGGFKISRHENKAYYGSRTVYGTYGIGELRITSATSPISISPSVTESFSNGQWTGMVTLSEMYPRVALLADDGSGHKGASNNFEVAPDLEVTPSADYIASGQQGGIYAPEIKDYTLKNLSGSAIIWDVTASESWVSVSDSHGVLPGGHSEIITVSLNGAVYSLAEGVHTAEVGFRDLGKAMTQTRQVELTISAAPVITDTTPPVILQGPYFSAIGRTWATLRWQTDENADTVVDYGPTSSMDTHVTGSGVHKYHYYPLSYLSPATTYYLQVASTDEFGNGPTQSDQITFETEDIEDTFAPILLAGPMTVLITDTQVQITWITDEPATSRVDYDDGASSSGFVFEPTAVVDHIIKIDGLEPDTAYSFIVSSSDVIDNGPSSRSSSFTTMPTPDTHPPIILHQPRVVTKTDQSSTIVWSTDEPSTSVVQFGLTQSLGSIVSNWDMVTEHEVTLTHLHAHTKYYYRVFSVDDRGNGSSLSRIDHFRTLPAPDDQPPVILSGPSVVYQSDTMVALTWTTDEVADSAVNYGTTIPLDQRIYNPERSKEHWVILTNLTPNQSYSYECLSTDWSGNTVVVPDSGGTKILLFQEANFISNGVPDTTAPEIIEGPTVVTLTDQLAAIEWKTNELTDSMVVYGLSSGSMNRVAGSVKPTFEHLMILTNLSASSEYSFKVSSRDLAGNEPVQSSVLTFTTEAYSDESGPLFIIGPLEVDWLDSTITITWENEEYCSGYIRYGTNPADLDQTISLDDMQDEHSVTLTNLTEGQTYYYQVILSDISGNTTESTVHSFVAQVQQTGLIDWKDYR